MRSRCGSDAVDGVLIFPGVGLKGGVHRFLQGLQSEAHRDHIGSQHLHACDVGGLLGYVHFPHIDIALHAPAPVSAMSFFFPMNLARSPSPMQWLSLWAPVWFRSSLFR